ncbi:MAG: stage V sporulation protein B [Clostridium sp.]
MEKDNFFRNSFLLTAANVTTGLLGFIFSIYLSKLLGPQGLGLYTLIMPVYNLFIALMTAGIIAAISKLAAIYSEKIENKNLIKTIRTISFFNILWSILVGSIVFATAPLIGEFALNDLRAVDAIRVTCPAMIFISLSNILKGYFLGTYRISMPAVIDILEKGVRIVLIFTLITYSQVSTIEGLVTIAYVCLCLGELQSLLLLYIYYRFTLNKLPKTFEKTERRGQLLFNVLAISVPLCLNGFLTSIFSMISTLIVPGRLMVAGFTYHEALGLIGKFSGMAMTLVFMPLIVVSSINSLLIPDLSQTLSKGKYYEAAVRIRKVMKIAFLLGMATTVICNLIPSSLGEIFYGRADLAQFIRFASLCAPIYFPSLCMFGILNGLDKQGIILRNSLIVASIELISLFILASIPNINIYAIGITMIITSIISFAINMYEVNKHIELNISITNIIIFILLGIFSYFLFKIIIAKFLGEINIIKTITIILVTFGLFTFWGTFGDES